MNDTEVMNMIKRHEGYRETLYRDSLGFLSGGYGHCFHYGSALPQDIWEQIFEHDYGQAVADYKVLNLDLDPVRRAVIIDMLFNLGLNGVRQFKRMLKALRIGNYGGAANEMLDSQWMVQVGKRADELAMMMRTGKP